MTGIKVFDIGKEQGGDKKDKDDKGDKDDDLRVGAEAESEVAVEEDAESIEMSDVIEDFEALCCDIYHRLMNKWISKMMNMRAQTAEMGIEIKPSSLFCALSLIDVKNYIFFLSLLSRRL